MSKYTSQIKKIYNMVVFRTYKNWKIIKITINKVAFYEQKYLNL